MQFKVQKLTTSELVGNDALEDLFGIAHNHIDGEGDYTEAHGWTGYGWDTFSEPGDAFLELIAGNVTAVAMFAHNDLLRAIVFTKEDE